MMASSGFDTTSPSALRRFSFLALLGLAGTTSAAALPRADVPAPYVAAPFYPSPHGGWADESDPWSAAYTKAVELVGSMTLAEKTNITAGTGFFMGTPCVGNTGSAERVGFPQLCLQDGPLGVRGTDNVTAFPAGITTGATFDKKLMYERGVALGQEFRGKGANMYLGPSVGALGRKPRGGRNWEGFGADPVLQAFAGAETVRGVQDQGVIAVTKHLIGNEQEVQRMFNVFQQGISANIDDRTMHEIYLWPFAEAVHEGTGAIMTSYNAVNGTAASQHSMLINGLLKSELGFQGPVMTDWLAQMSGVAAALAGTDLGMPGDTNVPIILGTAYYMYEMTRAALNGTVPMDRINDMATRVVAAWYKMGQDGEDYPRRPNFSANTRDREGPLYPAAVFSPRGVVNEFVNVQADHKVIAKQVAQDAVTLLKNDDGLLPLSPDAPLRVFGTDAQANPDGINACADKSCNKGTLGMGWGSGSADYPYMDDPIGSLRRKAGNVEYFATDKFPSKTPEPTDDDVAVVFISSDAGENSYTVEGNHGDRDASGLQAWHGGDELVRAAAARYARVVVVAHTVGPLIVEPWIDLPAVKAVLVAHLPGQEAGDSLTELLFGEASPSGHLPYTMAASEDDYDPATRIVPNGLGQPQDTFSDGIYVDYRHFQARNVTPRYAFGHGLTYTTFNLSGVTRTAGVARSEVPPAAPAPPPAAVAALNTTIPAAAEAYRPGGFNIIWRYLYSWLGEGEADRAYAVGAAGEKTYAYPPGYSTEQKPPARAGGASGGNPALWDVAFTVRATVANAGAVHAAKASAQLYVQFPASDRYDAPPLQLRDFAKTAALAPGAAETVELRLTRKDLSVWDVELQDWVWPEGRFAFWLGDASDSFSAVCYSDADACETDVPARGPL